MDIAVAPESAALYTRHNGTRPVIIAGRITGTGGLPGETTMKSYLVLLYSMIGIVLMTVGCDGDQRNAAMSAEDRNQAAAVPAYLRYGEENGRFLYRQYCQVCHGDEGDGFGFNAYNLDPKPRDFTDGLYMHAKSNGRLHDVIARGGVANNLSMLMPAWGQTLNTREITFLISYIRTFSDSTRAHNTVE